MKKTINFYDFERAFKEHGRINSFSYEGLRALFEHLEQFEEDTGEELELDVIAICGDFSEYEDLEEIKENSNDIETLEDLYNMTTVIEIPGTDRLIIMDY